MTKKPAPEALRGQLMLQIAAGRFFRPGVPINEHTHRRTVYSNAWFLDPRPEQLPVGSVLGSTDTGAVSTATIEALDRLEAQRPDGTDDFMVATGGDALIDDVAYVLTFVLNRTFARDHDLVLRLVTGGGRGGRRPDAAGLFPGLFDPQQVLHAADLDAVRQFMDELLALGRRDFARVMRVVRRTVDATRRAVEDPTGAYTDLVAALESLGDDHLTTAATWDRYDGRKRKIFDAVLRDEDGQIAQDVRAAALEADSAGLKRRFVSSTLARVSPAYYREQAVGTSRPPKSADLERMLSIAYDIRSGRSHVLEDLGDEVWVFSDGAETVFEPRFRHILTLAGVWRLVRHVTREFVAQAPKTQPEPWDYRDTLPGIVQGRLAPQYWVSRADGFDAGTAQMWLCGAADAFIARYSGQTDDGIHLTAVVEKIERLIPGMTDGPPKTAMVGLYALWREWTSPDGPVLHDDAFLAAHGSCLSTPSITAFVVGLLSNRGFPAWTADEWADVASARRAARAAGKEAPVPASADVLVQLEAADRLEAAGRHDDAVVHAANAVEECPGHEDVLDWEQRLLAGEHDPSFDVHKFLFGTSARTADATGEETGAADERKAKPDQDG
jgi:hypothetical protein